MFIDIYVSDVNRKKFIAVEAGYDISESGLTVIDSDFENVTISRRNVELLPQIIGIDPEAAMENILKQKYHIFGARVDLDEK